MAPILGLILAFSLVLRGIFFTHVPPELFGDEIDVGYQAYSLLKTGSDYRGHPLPVYFQSEVEWRAPLLMYATVPTVALFGNSTLGVRMPELIFGSLTPVVLTLIIYIQTRSKRDSLLAGFALAFMPWHIHYSRAAFEVALQLLLILTGVALHLRKRYLTSFIFLALALYTYNTSAIFIFLLLLYLWFNKLKHLSLRSVTIFGLLLVPFVLNLTFGKARERFSLISIFNDPEVISVTQSLRIWDPSPLSRLLYNRPTAYFKNFAKNYLHAFSPEFLFTYGDPVLRHGPQYFGNLIPVSIALVLVGLFHLLKSNHYFWILWLLVAPISSALTVDGSSHSTRLFLMVPALAAYLGFGMSRLHLRHVRLLLAILLLSAFQFAQYYHHYLVVYPKISWRWWQVGFEQGFAQIAKVQDQYQQVFINNTYEPDLIRYAFWGKVDPQIIQGQSFAIQNYLNYQGIHLSPKFYFGHFSSSVQNLPFNEKLLPNSLYFLSQRDEVGGDWDWRVSPPPGVKVLNTFTGPDNNPIFYLVTRL